MKYLNFVCLFFYLICGWAAPLMSDLLPEKIGTTTIPFFDDLRKRPIITEVWYPVEANAKAWPVTSIWKLAPEVRDTPFVCKNKKFPLILMSHGDSSSRMDNAWIGEYLASHGYIVASVDHYGDTWYLYHPREAIRFWERPKDISFVLEQMLNDPVFGPCINPEKVGFIGYSLGGLTGIWLAGGQADQYQVPTHIAIAPFHQAETTDQDLIHSIDFSKAKKIYKDPRIKAEVLMAPAYGNYFDKAGLESISIPIYIVAGENDKIAPIEKNGQHYASLIKSAQLEVIPRAGHFVFLNLPSGQEKIIPLRFLEDGAGIDRKKIHDDLAPKVLQFFNNTLH